MAIEDREDGRLESVFEAAKTEARKKYEGKPLKELVQAQRDVGQMKEQLEDQLKRVNAEFDVLRFEMVPTRMDDEGIDKVAYDGIGRVSLTPDIFVSTKPGAKEGLFKWFKKHKLADLIQPSVNASTLKAWVKKRIKEGKDVPTDFLNVTPVTRASITKQ